VVGTVITGNIITVQEPCQALSVSLKKSGKGLEYGNRQSSEYNGAM